MEKVLKLFSKNNFLYNTIYWTIFKYLKYEDKCIVNRRNLEYLVYLLTGVEISIYEYDYLEDLCDYDLSKIGSNDVVLNIGAGAGLYALLSASICRHVYVIEPILTKILLKNIKQSKFKDKITILDYAFGKDGYVECNYWGKRIKIKSKSIQTILNELDPTPTYIKCDCEGCEFDGFIACKDFKDVRYIELEYHTNNPEELKKLVNHFKSNGFTTRIIYKKPTKEFKHLGIIRASKY